MLLFLELLLVVVHFVDVVEAKFDFVYCFDDLNEMFVRIIVFLSVV